MTEQNLSYYLMRAATELRSAQAAQDPRAIKAHVGLAACYVDRAYCGKVGDSSGIALPAGH